ncbi:hypothetical protein LshimejAT787_1802000 [Lyophyllum shimeji]|uniref:DUF6534 domain-containing protein n=1 Tax=Lyophyllum shimeji TaxID=47721 RepID=A0A9P3PZI1_LYOSH|nr:hypothetical protein LshimejAT787_1802000 [Lyophyllum shimeji]
MPLFNKVSFLNLRRPSAGLDGLGIFPPVSSSKGGSRACEVWRDEGRIVKALMYSPLYRILSYFRNSWLNYQGIKQYRNRHLLILLEVFDQAIAPDVLRLYASLVVSNCGCRRKRPHHGPSIYKPLILERQRAIFLLGPWLIGSCLDIFLQGALCSQFIVYFTYYNNDRIGTRLAVSGLTVLTTLKTIHSFVTIWIMLILHFKDLDGAINLNYTAWWQTGDSLMVATIGLYVQTFFCQRLWRISKRNVWFVLPVVLVVGFAYISICLATYFISVAENSPIGIWFAAHLSGVFAGDLLITVFTAYFLLSSREDVLPQTVGVLRALVRLTFQTAAPAALCAMFNLLFSQLYSGQVKLISVAFNQMLPKLYAFSMMWTLNARRSIRATGGFSSDTGRTGDTSSRRRGDVELLTVGQRIQVRTQTDVTQHIDFSESGGTKEPLEEVKRKE